MPATRTHAIAALALACACAPALAAPASPKTQPQTQPQPPAQSPADAQARALAAQPPVPPPAGHHLALDESGRKQIGKASVYSHRFQGRHMADGHRFHETGQAAASKTLPIGTVAKVTNTQTGRTATVRVEDHGPFVDGRTLDVSRATAAQLGITHHDGVAPVVVAPVTVPQRNGEVHVGAGAVPGPAN